MNIFYSGTANCSGLWLRRGRVEYDREKLIDYEIGHFYPVGTTATFTCDAGYSPSSSSETCEESGNWTGPNPTYMGNIRTD